MKRLTILLVASVLMVGCATMNRPECKNADWHMIGMEDGTQGRSPDYIGHHRQACAKHNVTPDLNEYIKGQQDGIRQFCSAPRGLQMGERGVKYDGVCPPDLEPLFLVNYNAGSKLRMMNNEINSISSHINSDKGHLKELKDALKKKEDQLIHKENSEDARALLVRESKDLQEEIEKFKGMIREQEEYREIKKLEYQQFNR